MPMINNRRPHTCHKGSAYSQSNWRIHAYPTEFDISPRITEKGATGIKNNREREQQT